MEVVSSVKRFLVNMYCYSFFNTLTLLSPVYAVFMQSHGLSDFQVSSLIMLWSVGVLFTQIPVTWAARRLGVKTVLIVGQCLKAFAFVLWLVWPTYLGFAIGMLIWGMQGAIYNVVSEDVLYDELKARTHSNMYARVLGRRKNVYALGTALSSAGSLLLFFGYGWITAASVLSLLISVVFIARLRLKLPYGAVDDQTSSGFLKSLSTGARIVRKTPAILSMLALSVLVTNFSYLNDYLSLIGYNIGLRPEYIGIVPFFILCCQMLGQAVAHKFTRVRNIYLYPFVVVAGVLFILFSVFYNMWGLLILGAAYVVCSAIKILLYSRFQDLTPSRYRLEILSLYSIADQMSYMMVCLIIGLSSLGGSWRYSVMTLGVLLCMVGLWAIAFVRHRRRRTPEIKAMPGIRPAGTDIV